MDSAVQMSVDLELLCASNLWRIYQCLRQLKFSIYLEWLTCFPNVGDSEGGGGDAVLMRVGGV